MQDASGIRVLRADAEATELEIGSGTYRFEGTVIGTWSATVRAADPPATRGTPRLWRPGRSHVGAQYSATMSSIWNFGPPVQVNDVPSAR